jgi:hypothetical protein
VTEEERTLAIARLSSREATRVLAAILTHKDPPGCERLAAFTGLPRPAVRSMIMDGRSLGWIEEARPARNPGYVLTQDGRDNLTRLATHHATATPLPPPPLPVIDGNDQPSTPTMTGAPARGRGGKPAWCRPGVGCCRGCKEPS